VGTNQYWWKVEKREKEDSFFSFVEGAKPARPIGRGGSIKQEIKKRGSSSPRESEESEVESFRAFKDGNSPAKQHLI
jgi:hypothetical protein